MTAAASGRPCTCSQKQVHAQWAWCVLVVGSRLFQKKAYADCLTCLQCTMMAVTPLGPHLFTMCCMLWASLGLVTVRLQSVISKLVRIASFTLNIELQRYWYAGEKPMCWYTGGLDRLGVLQCGLEDPSKQSAVYCPKWAAEVRSLCTDAKHLQSWY